MGKKKLEVSTRAKSHTSRDLSDHIVGETSFVEEGVEDAPVKDIGWDVKQAEVDSGVQLREDKGEGEAIIVRSFDFKANPEAFREDPPTKQELFNAHIGQIEMILMQDGLKLFTDVEPRLKLSKKKEGYRITIAATPRKGWGLLEKPQTLSEILQ